jgi:uncharacterized membrane protein YkoI
MMRTTRRRRGAVHPLEYQMYKAVLALAALSSLALTQAFAGEPSEAALMSQAKVSKAVATRTALSRVPGAQVKSAEIEREHGRLIWSFDLAQAGKSGITEIQVSAITGKIVSQQHESGAHEAAEAAAEARGK